MDSIGDLLQGKADNLDLSRGDDLQLIQIELDRLFGPGVARASQITNRAELIILTQQTEDMTTVRYGYTQIMSAIRNQTDREIKKLVVKLSSS